ncbi:MAG: flgI [Phycisphaerales bacterium]|nr:flgI [Phycisphaerales bacterium]
MHPVIQHLGKPFWRGAISAACATGLLLLGGCSKNAPPKVAKPAYTNIGLRTGLPAYLKDTVLERSDLSNTGVLAVSSYGLVVNLRYSGDSNTTPTAVREWMIKEMYRHGFGGHRIPGYQEMTPERALADKRNSIVIAGAFIPPGARIGQRVDAYCQALPQSNTASLAGGTLYQCELRLYGANALDPGGSVNKYVEARGPLFINPAYALETPKPTEGVARSGARTATVMGGGLVTTDRALQLRLRTPQWSISRAMEMIINTRFQGVADKHRQDGRGLCVAEAQDDGYLNLYVPVSFKGNWERFAGVATHLYINLNPSVAAVKAQELAEAAKRPGAMLEDISFALEGLGPVAIPYIIPLLAHPAPDVRYAAARAGAYLGDTASEDALITMAKTPGTPFRLNAILTLADLPNNPEINRAMASCLDAAESPVRINAYKVLAAHGDPRVISRQIADNFVLDVVDSKGPPLIYATRTGEPRLAVFGGRTAINQPITFAAFDTELTITTDAEKPSQLSVFYRGSELSQPVKTASRPNVAELAARLGGLGDEKLHFGYGDIVGILQSMADRGKVSATFVLQDQPGVDDVLVDTPDTTGGGRAVGDPGIPQTPATGAPRAGTPTAGVNGLSPVGNGAAPGRPN